MKILILLLLVSFIRIQSKDVTIKKNTPKTQKLESCSFNGKKLYGKIQFVATPGEADIKVKIVNSFADLKVRFVENSPNSCGKWQIVETNGSLKVYITENFPDIKIKPVVSFPGVAN